jgi:VanZ family protein
MLYATCALTFQPEKDLCNLSSVTGYIAYSMSIKLKNLLYYWLPLIIYCLAIYIQSDLPASEHIPSFEFSDKILHFVAYALMGVLFFRAYQTLRIKDNLRLLILLSIVSASLYGISDEIHQYFIPFRDASLFDVIADILGAVCGVYLYHRWAFCSSRKQTTQTDKFGL